MIEQNNRGGKESGLAITVADPAARLVVVKKILDQNKGFYHAEVAGCLELFEECAETYGKLPLSSAFVTHAGILYEKINEYSLRSRDDIIIGEALGTLKAAYLRLFKEMDKVKKENSAQEGGR